MAHCKKRLAGQATRPKPYRRRAVAQLHTASVCRSNGLMCEASNLAVHDSAGDGSYHRRSTDVPLHITAMLIRRRDVGQWSQRQLGSGPGSRSPSDGSAPLSGGGSGRHSESLSSSSHSPKGRLAWKMQHSASARGNVVSKFCRDGLKDRPLSQRLSLHVAGHGLAASAICEGTQIVHRRAQLLLHGLSMTLRQHAPTAGANYIYACALLELFFPMPSLSTVSSVHDTACHNSRRVFGGCPCEDASTDYELVMTCKTRPCLLQRA